MAGSAFHPTTPSPPPEPTGLSSEPVRACPLTSEGIWVQRLGMGANHRHRGDPPQSWAISNHLIAGTPSPQEQSLEQGNDIQIWRFSCTAHPIRFSLADRRTLARVCTLRILMERSHFRMKLYKQSVLGLALGLTFASCFLVLVSAPRNPESIDLSISHLGTRNFRHWGPCSFFGVTNKSSFTVTRWPSFDVEDKKSGTSILAMYQENRFLRPGEGEIIVFQRPTNQGPWRLVLTLTQTSLRSRFMDRFGGHRWSELIPLRLRGVPCEFLKSDWVEGESK